MTNAPRYSVSLTRYQANTIMRALLAVGRSTPPPNPVAQVALQQAYEAIRLPVLAQDRKQLEKEPENG